MAVVRSGIIGLGRFFILGVLTGNIFSRRRCEEIPAYLPVTPVLCHPTQIENQIENARRLPHSKKVIHTHARTLDSPKQQVIHAMPSEIDAESSRVHGLEEDEEQNENEDPQQDQRDNKRRRVDPGRFTPSR